MTKTISLFALMMFAVFLAACDVKITTGDQPGRGRPDNADESPKLVIERYNGALRDHDHDRAESVFTVEFWKREGQRIRRDFDDWRRDEVVVRVDYNDADIVVEGDRAHVKSRVIVRHKDGHEEAKDRVYRMRKVDHKWRIDE